MAVVEGFDVIEDGSSQQVCAVAEKGRLAPVPPAMHMINRARILDAQRPGH